MLHRFGKPTSISWAILQFWKAVWLTSLQSENRSH